ncbi:MAG: hypothetical protein ACPLRX_03835 [Candidatus Saccharicenans sp.]
MKIAFWKGRQIARRLILSILLALLVVLAREMARNSATRVRLTGSFRVEARGQTSGEQFVAEEYSGPKKSLSIRADDFYLDEKQNEHLEGQVEVTDEGSEVKATLRAGHLIIPPGRKKVEAENGVEVEFDGLLIKAEVLEYSVEEKAVRAPRAEVIGRNFVLSGEGFSYHSLSRSATFDGKFQGHFGSQKEGFNISGKKAWWEAKKNLLSVEELVLTSGKVQLTSPAAAINLNDSDGRIESATFEGGACFLSRSNQEKSDLQEVKIMAGELTLEKNGERYLALAAKGFSLEGTGKKLSVTGGGVSLRLAFYMERGPEKLETEKSEFKVLQGDYDRRHLKAEKIDYDLLENKMVLSGQAAALFKHQELSAREIRLQVSEQELEASFFQMAIRPGFFTGEMVFFNQDRIIYLTGEKLSQKEKLIRGEGNLRMWQDDCFLMAEKMSADESSGRVEVEQEVTLNGRLLAPSGIEKNLNLSAGRVILLSEEQKIKAEHRTDLRFDGLTIKAPVLGVHFAKNEKAKLLGLEFPEGLEISWKDYQAQGKRGFYQAEKDVLEIQLQAELIDRNGQRVTADKLTLFLADDRIFVENQKRKRSQIILVRAK